VHVMGVLGAHVGSVMDLSNIMYNAPEGEDTIAIFIFEHVGRQSFTLRAPPKLPRGQHVR
jgi:hypothetical protein